MCVFAEELAPHPLSHRFSGLLNLQAWHCNLPAVCSTGIPSLLLQTVTNCLHQCWLNRVQPCRWVRMWPSYLRHLLCHLCQELLVAVECLLEVASGHNCWTSTLALPTAPCLPTTPSSNRNQVGGQPTQWTILSVDLGPSQYTSQASLLAQAPVELGPLESRLWVSQGCFPMEPASLAVWTVLLHQGTRVSTIPVPHFTLAFSHQLNVNISVFLHFLLWVFMM